MDPKRLLGNVPLITKEGYFDPAQFPIDGVLKQALSDDDQEFRTGLNMLRSIPCMVMDVDHDPRVGSPMTSATIREAGTGQTLGV